MYRYCVCHVVAKGLGKRWLLGVIDRSCNVIRIKPALALEARRVSA